MGGVTSPCWDRRYIMTAPASRSAARVSGSKRSAEVSRLGSHAYDRKAVITFYAYSLYGSAADAAIRRHLFDEAPDSLHAFIAAVGVNDRSIPHDVIDDDYSPRPRQLQRPFEICGDVLLVGVDEDQIKRSAPVGRESRKRLQCVADLHLDYFLQTCAGQISLRNRGVARVDFERYQVPAWAHPSRQPDRAVSAQGADLQDRARSQHLR